MTGLARLDGPETAATTRSPQPDPPGSPQRYPDPSGSPQPDPPASGPPVGEATPPAE